MNRMSRPMMEVNEEDFGQDIGEEEDDDEEDDEEDDDAGSAYSRKTAFFPQ